MPRSQPCELRPVSTSQTRTDSLALRLEGLTWDFMVRRHKRTALFHELATNLTALRPGVDQIVCCPLCLREFPFEAIQQLRAEHIVSQKLGGRSQTLTCFDCNSRHGTTLDSQLIKAMKAMDSVEGTEPISTIISNAKGRIAADLLLPVVSETAPITMHVIGKTSSPAATEDLRSNLAPDYELKLHMSFGFIPERYWRAVLRSAYLAVFHAEGYLYAFSSGAACVRGVVNGTAPVRANIIMEAFPEQAPPGDLLVMPHAFTDSRGVLYGVAAASKQEDAIPSSIFARQARERLGLTWNLVRSCSAIAHRDQTPRMGLHPDHKPRI